MASEFKCEVSMLEPQPAALQRASADLSRIRLSRRPRYSPESFLTAMTVGRYGFDNRNELAANSVPEV
jgi:hypothetical protein